MKETTIGIATHKEYEISYRQWLDDKDLYLVLDGREVHLPTLLKAIPHEVLLRAASTVDKVPANRTDPAEFLAD